MRVRGPNNVGRAGQTDLTLLSFASAIKRNVGVVVQKFDRCETLHNNYRQHPKTFDGVRKRTCNIPASICMGLNTPL